MTIQLSIDSLWATLRQLYSLLARWIVGPIVAAVIGIALVAPIKGLWVGPDYVIYFVGPLTEPGVTEMVQIFKNAEGQPRQLAGTTVKFRSVDDKGDPFVARRLAASLAANDNTLLVVGHVFSSTTKEALPAYLSEADPPIPVILTTETNPTILPPKQDANTEYPVFRLSPPDDAQAKAAVAFARQHGGKAFWVVEDDASNLVYSHFLAQRLVENAQGKETRVLLMSGMSYLPPIQTVRQLNVEWILFAGDWRAALILVRQLKALNLTGVQFILSDGCATQEFLDAGGAELDGIYVTHAVSATVFAERHYGVFAADSLIIIDKILDRANQDFSDSARKRGEIGYYVRRTLGMHRIQDARAAMLDAIKNLRDSPIMMSTGDPAKFNRNGERIDAKVHVWKIVGGKFSE